MKRFVAQIAAMFAAMILAIPASADDAQIAKEIIGKLRQQQQSSNLQGFDLGVQVDKGTVTVQAGDYAIPGIMKGLLGERYRAIWTGSVEVPVIDLEKTAGGLTPIKKGGGFQTTSLRMQGADGDQYVLRSINS